MGRLLTLPEGADVGQVSDGFHTFDELYESRMALNAALFNTWDVEDRYGVHKSRRHHDGALCFGGGWFIVSAMLPEGQISFHYEEEFWELFDIPEEERTRWAYDGHTASDVNERLMEEAVWEWAQ